MPLMDENIRLSETAGRVVKHSLPCGGPGAFYKLVRLLPPGVNVTGLNQRSLLPLLGGR